MGKFSWSFIEGTGYITTLGKDYAYTRGIPTYDTQNTSAERPSLVSAYVLEKSHDMKLGEFVGHTFELCFRELLFVFLSCGRAWGVCGERKAPVWEMGYPCGRCFQSANQRRR